MRYRLQRGSYRRVTPAELADQAAADRLYVEQMTEEAMLAPRKDPAEAPHTFEAGKTRRRLLAADLDYDK